MHHQTFDGAFEVARAILDVCTLLQQMLLGGFGDREHEGAFRGRQEDPLLHLAKFEIEDAPQLRLTKRLELQRPCRSGS